MTTLTAEIAKCYEMQQQVCRESCIEWTEGELADGDCDAICEALGRKPTREEWRSAGFGYVGSKHVSEDA